MLAETNQSDDASLATNATPNIPQLSKSKLSIKKLLKMRLSESALSQNDSELPGSGPGHLTPTESLDASSSESVICENELILPVECGTNKAELYLSKLCMGSKGRSIKFHGSWLTPNEFQYVSGRETAKDWKRSIRHYGKSLKLLLTKGIMKSDATNPTCECEGCKPDGKSEFGLCNEKENNESVFTDSCDTTWDLNQNNQITTNSKNQNGPVFPGMILEDQDGSEVNSEQDTTEENKDCENNSTPHLPLGDATENGKSEEGVEEYGLKLKSLLGNSGLNSEIFPVEEGSSLHSLMSMCTSEGLTGSLFETKSQEKGKNEVESESTTKLKDEQKNCEEDVNAENNKIQCSNEKENVENTREDENSGVSHDSASEEVTLERSRDASVSPDSSESKATFGNVFNECIEKHYSQGGDTEIDSDKNLNLDSRKSEDDVTVSHDQEALDLEKKRICAKIAWPPSYKDDYQSKVKGCDSEIKNSQKDLKDIHTHSDLKYTEISQVLTATKDSMKAMVNARQKEVKVIPPAPVHLKKEGQFIQTKIKTEDAMKTSVKKETNSNSSAFSPPLLSPGGVLGTKISPASVTMSPTALQMAQSYYWASHYNDYMQYLGNSMLYQGKLTDTEYLNYLRRQQNRWYGVGTHGSSTHGGGTHVVQGKISQDPKNKQTEAGLKNSSQDAKLYSMEHKGKHEERKIHRSSSNHHLKYQNSDSKFSFSANSKHSISTNELSTLKRSHSEYTTSERPSVPSSVEVDALDLTSKKPKIDNVSTRNPYYPYYPPLCYPQVSATGSDVMDLSRPSKLEKSVDTSKDVVKDLLLRKRLPESCGEKKHEKDLMAALNWSVQEVYGFVASIDVCAEYAPIFKLHQIDGKSLPYLTPDILTSHMGMKLGPALTLKAAILKVTGFCHQCSHCSMCHEKK